MVDPVRLGPLVRLGEQHRDDAEHADEQHGADQHAGDGQVLLREVVQRPDEQRRRCVDDDREEAAAAVAQRVAVEIEQPQQERGRQHRRGGEHLPVRHSHDRRAELEFLLAVGVVDAPVGAGLAFGRGLPRLVERFHDEVFVAVRARRSARKRRRNSAWFETVATADSRVRPSLGQPTSPITIGLPGKRRAQFAELVVDVADGLLDLDAFPVRQHVHRDEIDVVRTSSGCSIQTCHGSAVLTGWRVAARTRSRCAVRSSTAGRRAARLRCRR